MKKQILSLIPVVLIGATVFANSPSPFVLKWDISMATPGTQGLVTLTPRTQLTLARGHTDDVFAFLGETVPEEENAHRAVSLEFRFRFLRGTSEISTGTLHVDQHGAFITAHHPVASWDEYTPANQELFSTESLTVPAGADSLEMRRTAIDTIAQNRKVSDPVTFALVGSDTSVLVESGDSRGDTKSSPKPYILGGAITGGKPLVAAFDEFRAMNAWVRTAPSLTPGGGFIAPYSGTDARTITCLNKTPNAYYAAWADMPHFEIVTRIRFDQGDWQELPEKKLYPAWIAGATDDLSSYPFDTIPGIFRSADPYNPSDTATIFPQTDSSHLAPLATEKITVPPHATTLSVQTRIHGYLIAQYGNLFQSWASGYVGDDCLKIYTDGERVELEDLWDTPDFTSATAWTFPVN